MQTVGIVGLGIMGSRMAANLVTAGFDVIGYNRSEAALTELVERGGRRADSIAEVASAAQVIVLMLPDSPDVEAVVSGAGGVFANAATGSIVIDCSTISPPVATRLAAEAARAGIAMLDAPVSGGAQGAADATLSIMVGGDPATLEQVRPVLGAMGSTIVHVGPAGSGQAVKAANQLVVGGTIALVAEAIVLLEALDVPAGPALEVLKGGLAGSKVLEVKSAAMLAGDFTPGFRIELHDKDLGIVTAAARQAGIGLPVTGLVAQLMTAAKARGLGGSDHGALLALAREFAGR